jgi:hypothetical protein
MVKSVIPGETDLMKSTMQTQSRGTYQSNQRDQAFIKPIFNAAAHSMSPNRQMFTTVKTPFMATRQRMQKEIGERVVVIRNSQE